MWREIESVYGSVCVEIERGCVERDRECVWECVCRDRECVWECVCVENERGCVER